MRVYHAREGVTQQLSVEPHEPAENREPLVRVETRIAALTQQFAEIMDRWTLSDLRHTRAIGEMEARLKDLESIKARVEHNAEDHLRSLEQKVAHEWTALQHMLEQPIQQLQEHAARLRETSVATAGTALSGLESAETRLAAIQADMSERMNQLSRDVQTTLAQLREGLPHNAQASPGAPNWPLDQVMRLHEGLREEDRRDNDGEDRPHAAPEPKTITLLAESSEATGGDVAERPKDGRTRLWVSAIIVLVIGLAIAATFAFRLQREFEAASAKMAQAEQQAQATRAAAEQQIAASRKEAELRIVEANETALRAQMVSEVLASPDLVRYGLSGGGGTPAARGQLLWSRSRGIVLSASRLPKAPPGSTYHLWLMTASGATRAGAIDADSEGRLSLATDRLPAVPRPVIGVVVTMEPLSSGPEPSGPAVLSYLPPQQIQQAP